MWGEWPRPTHGHVQAVGLAVVSGLVAAGTVVVIVVTVRLRGGATGGRHHDPAAGLAGPPDGVRAAGGGQDDPAAVLIVGSLPEFEAGKSGEAKGVVCQVTGEEMSTAMLRPARIGRQRDHLLSQNARQGPVSEYEDRDGEVT